MNLSKLFETQKQLDNRIEEGHGLEGNDLLEDKVLALQVELGELANETRCFKFWSKKPPSEKVVVLEEYVDGLHFILSLGNLLNSQLKGIVPGRFFSLSETLNELFACVADLNRGVKKMIEIDVLETYKALFSLFMGLGRQLGFTETEIEQAYYAKNQINHERQANGY